VPRPSDPQSLNRYSYVLNRPTTGSDPDGHCFPVCTAIVGGVVGAVAGAAIAAVPTMIQNAQNHQPLTANIDPAQVGKAAAMGFLAGAAAGATLGAGAVLVSTNLRRGGAGRDRPC